MPKVVSVRQQPDIVDVAIRYIQSKWANANSMAMYDDCIRHALTASIPLPQWYLLYANTSKPIGCAGLITNDFISRSDLYPWACALYVEESARGNNYGALLLDQAKTDARAAGFSYLYLCTDHVGYYERFGYEYIGTGYHPWGESSRIYRSEKLNGR
jgi:N-acetylglutamate synthase and related acetyltransferases